MFRFRRGKEQSAIEGSPHLVGFKEGGISGGTEFGLDDAPITGDIAGLPEVSKNLPLKVECQNVVPRASCRLGSMEDYALIIEGQEVC